LRIIGDQNILKCVKSGNQGAESIWEIKNRGQLLTLFENQGKALKISDYRVCTVQPKNLFANAKPLVLRS
jgi:hypothetical protein